MVNEITTKKKEGKKKKKVKKDFYCNANIANKTIIVFVCPFFFVYYINIAIY